MAAGGKSSSRRKWLIAGGGTAVAVIAAALIIPSFLDWNKYRPEIESVAKALTGREVTIGGPVTFTLLPSPAFTARQVAIANLPGGTAKHMAEIDALDVRVALFPLMVGDFDVSKIVLQKPIINLETLTDGRDNWDFGDGEDTENTGRRSLRLDNFVIETGQISYLDQRDGSKRELSDIGLTVSVGSIDGPYRANGMITYQAVPISLDLSMGRKGIKGKTAFKGFIGFGKAKIETSGIATLEEPFAYEGTVKITSPNLGETATAVQMLSGATDVSGMTFAQQFNADFRLTYNNTSFETQALTFNIGETKGNGRLIVALHDVPRVAMTLGFSSVDADAIIQSLPAPDPAKPPLTTLDILSALDPGNIAGELTVTADAIRHRERVIRQAELRLAAADGKIAIQKFHALLPGGSDVDMIGTLTGGDKPRFEGRIATASNNLRALLDWMQIEIKGVPPGRLTNFAIVSGITMDDTQTRFTDAVFRLDTMTAKGQVNYTPGPKPALALNAAVDRLDVTSYLAEGSQCGLPAETDPKANRSQSTLGPQDDFDIGNLNLVLKLTVDRFSCRPLDGQAVSIDASLNSGSLVLNAFKAKDLLGLQVNAQGKVNDLKKTQRFDVSMTASGDSLAAVGKAFPNLLPAAPEKIGSTTIKARAHGTPEAMTVAVSGNLGATSFGADGQMAFIDTKGLSDFSLDVTAKNPSFAALSKQWDLDIEPPTPADDSAVSLDGQLKGRGDTTSFDIAGRVAKGTINAQGNTTLSRATTRTGQDTRSYNLNLTIKGDDARGFVRGIGVPYGDNIKTIGPIALATVISGDNRAVAVTQLDGTFGPTKLNGAITMTLGEQRPRIGGALTAGAVDLDRLLGFTPQSKTPDGKEWSDTPYDLSLLNNYNVDLKLKAATVSARGYVFEAPNFALIIENGRLAIKDLSGKLFDGAVDLNFVFGGADVPTMNLSFDIANASLQKALRTAANVDAITGSANIKGGFTGQGRSPAELVRSINGASTLNLGNGIIQGINMPQLSQDLKTVSDAASVLKLLTNALADGKTVHKGFSGTVQAVNGVLTLPNMSSELDAAKALLAISVDMPNWRVSSSGRMQLTEHPKIPPIGVDISGSLTDPKVKYVTKDVQTFVAAEIARSLLERAAGGGAAKADAQGKPATKAEDATPVPAAPAKPAQSQPTQKQPATPQEQGKALFENLLKSLNEKEPKKP